MTLAEPRSSNSWGCRSGWKHSPPSARPSNCARSGHSWRFFGDGCSPGSRADQTGTERERIAAKGLTAEKRSFSDASSAADRVRRSSEPQHRSGNGTPHSSRRGVPAGGSPTWQEDAAHEPAFASLQHACQYRPGIVIGCVGVPRFGAYRCTRGLLALLLPAHGRSRAPAHATTLRAIRGSAIQALERTVSAQLPPKNDPT